MSTESNLIKINPPVSQSTLFRDRLFRQVDGARERSLLFISAPAGAGKTTLVSSYIEEKNLPCLWYQIDSGDADPATFFHYFKLACANAVGDDGTDLPSFKPEQSYGVREFGRQFFSKTYACLPPNSVVVLDDLQEAGDAQVLDAVILAAMDRIPNGVTFILLSRSGPSPTYSRLFANRQGSQLRWEDLRFTLEEFKAILDMRQSTMSAASADHIHRLMDGWIAGLHLSMEVSLGEGSEWDGDDSPQTMFDYFSYEVFSKLGQRLQNFLIKTAFVSPLSIPMAEAISEEPKADAFLQGLHRHNHFTYKKRQAEVVYHYHPLFRDFLLQQALKCFSQEEVYRLRSTAASLLIETQRFEEAVTCLRQLEDWDRLTAVILRAAPTLMTQGRHLTLLKWIGHLPDALVQEEPWLLFWSGAGQLYLNPRESQTIFEKAYYQFEKQAHVTGMLQSCACVTDTIICEYGGLSRLDDWVGKMARMWTQGIQFEDDALKIDVTYAMLSISCFRRNDHPQIPIWKERAKAMFAQIEDANRRLKMGIRLLMIANVRGDFRDARTLSVDCESIIRHNSNIGPLDRIRFFFTKSMYEWLAGEFSACLQTVAQALDYTDTSGIRILDTRIAWTGVFAGLGMGDQVLVGRYCKVLEARPPLNENEKVAAFLIESYRAMLQGDTAIALNAAEQCLPLTKASGFVWTEAMVKVCLGQLLTQTGNRARGVRLLREALATGEAMGSNYIVFNALIYCAADSVSTHNDAKGDEWLRRALSLGRAEGYYNLLWFQPAVVSEVCARALTAGIEVDYVHALIRKRAPMLAAPSQAAENWPWPLRIYTLGRFEVVINDHPLKFTGRAQQKPLELLKALIAFGGREVSVARICDALWPDTNGDLQHQTFATTLHRLRKLLGIKQALVLNDGNLSLDKRHCWVDVWAFDGLIERAGKTAAVGAASLKTARRWEKALSFYRGRFLASVDSYWALNAREKYRRRYLDAVESLGQYHEDGQDFSDAAATCQTALEIHPSVERFYQRIIRCYRQMGDKSEAVAAYMRCKAALADRLHIQPSEETAHLYRTLSDSKM